MGKQPVIVKAHWENSTVLGPGNYYHLEVEQMVEVLENLTKTEVEYHEQKFYLQKAQVHQN